MEKFCNLHDMAGFLGESHVAKGKSLVDGQDTSVMPESLILKVAMLVAERTKDSK